MLTDSPCIKYLVGCGEGYLPLAGSTRFGDDDNDRTVSSIQQGSDNVETNPSGTRGGSFSVASDGVLGESGSASNTLDDLRNLQARLPRFASGSTLRTKLKDSYAEYVLSVRNTGRDVERSAKVTHGPLPFGATFDPSTSARECSLNGKTVECTVQLAPGQSKDLLLTYKSTSSFGCAIAKVLQSAKVSLGSVTGTVSTNPVVVSVRCSMKTVDRTTENLSTSRGSEYLGTVRSEGSLGYAEVFVGSGELVAGLGGGKKPTDGYKPYIAALPRTGSSPRFFQSVAHHSSSLVPVAPQSVGFSFLPLLLLSAVSTAVLAVLILRGLAHKKA